MARALALAGLVSVVTPRIAAQQMRTDPGPPQSAAPPAAIPQQTARGAIPVVLQGDAANLEMGLALGGDDRPFVRCVGACVDIERPSTMLVHPRTHGAQRSGLILGVLGIALIGAGGAAVLAAETGGDTSEGSVTLLGLGAVITGLVLTPIGWIKYGRSSPDLEVLAPM
jgi:hypothetical protein